MTVYHFDTLPIHPQPEPLESLSSYLTRLAEANGLRRIENLFRLCFPTGHSRLTFRTGDFPPPSFGGLPSLAQCPEPDLLATTFYHLGRKFDRTLKPLSLAQCLSGSISSQLRYCPLCLADRSYYLLWWRFGVIEGCPEHRCRFLERCGHCGQSIPLLSSPPKLGLCPTCGGDLRSCQVEKMEPNWLNRVINRVKDIVYLLGPQPCDSEAGRVTPVIGRRFSQWRQIRRLKIRDIADMLEVPLSTIYHLEQGPAHRGARFQYYLEYADVLGVTLRDIFLSPAPEVPLQSQVEKLLIKVRQAVTILEQQDEVITQEAILKIIGVEGKTIFCEHPQIKAIWVEIKKQERQRFEQKLLSQVQLAIAELRQQGQLVTERAITDLMGRSIDGKLRKNYPAVQRLLLQHRDTPSQRSRTYPDRLKYRREEELLIKVQGVIARLEGQGQIVSRQSIANQVGITAQGLSHYPQIKQLLQKYDAKQKPQDETILLHRVQDALAQLEADEAPITVEAVSQTVGLSSGTLHYYPQVKAFLTEHILDKKQEYQAKQRQRKEAVLIRKIQQAIEIIRTGDNRISQHAICNLVGMSAVNLKRYPQVKLLLRQIVYPDNSIQLLTDRSE